MKNIIVVTTKDGVFNCILDGVFTKELAHHEITSCLEEDKKNGWNYDYRIVPLNDGDSVKLLSSPLIKTKRKDIRIDLKKKLYGILGSKRVDQTTLIVANYIKEELK